MESLEGLNEVKETNEMKDILEKYFKLQIQLRNPTREGMIDALSGAKGIAQKEIEKLEQSQGDIYFTLWHNFSYDDLYRKLSQYQEGLYKYVVKKLGEKATKELFKDYIKANQNL